MALAQVPFDPELAAFLKQMPASNITRETIPMLRQFNWTIHNAELILAASAITHEERTITGPGGDLVVSIFRSKTSSPDGNKPGIYFIHGGGMIMGNRFLGIRQYAAEWVVEFDAVLVTIEYRLAPEHPYPAAIEDCYAGLLWLVDHFEELRIDPKRLLLSGASAGGGLAAGISLLARDRRGPKFCAQHLMYPMIDDRNETFSSLQCNVGTWTGDINVMAWDCYLDGGAKGKDVSIYAAPARATDLAGVSPAYLEVGSAEPFRDEVVAYASRLWASGIPTALHVWPGAWHGYDILCPTAVVSQETKETRNAWVRKVFAASALES
jgi:acetyl esterase/lipase